MPQEAQHSILSLSLSTIFEQLIIVWKSCHRYQMPGVLHTNTRLEFVLSLLLLLALLAANLLESVYAWGECFYITHGTLLDLAP